MFPASQSLPDHSERIEPCADHGHELPASYDRCRVYSYSKRTEPSFYELGADYCCGVAYRGLVEKCAIASKIKGGCEW